VDRILLMLWAVGFIFSAFLTLGTLIVTLCLKGTARSISVNFLLLIATCNIMHIIAVPYLSVPQDKPQSPREQTTKVGDSLKRWSRTFDEACKIEYAQKHWPALKCATAFEFPFRDPDKTFRDELEGLKADSASEPSDGEVVDVVMRLVLERITHNRVVQEPISESVINVLPPGWLKDQAIAHIAVHAKADAKFLNELERRRQAEGERFAVVMALYCLFHLSVLVSGLVVVSNSILWIRTADRSPNPSIRLIASGRTVYSVFVIGIYASMAATIPSEIFNYAYKDAISKLSATALSSICGCLGIMTGGLIATKKMILKQSGLTIKEAFPFQVAPEEWPLRIKQGFLTFLASTTFSTILWVLQWNIFGPIGTKNAFNISVPQLASDFHLDAVVLNAVAIIIIAPISEELLFRGLLFGWLRRGHSLLIAAAISAFFFSLCHFDLQLIPNLFFVGIVFAISYERTRSLVPNMIGHALHNFAMVLAVFVVR